MAVANYHDMHGSYPPAYVADSDGKPMHSWRILVLPFIEEKALFDQYDFSQPWNSEANLQLAEQMPKMYAFHGEYRPGVVTTNYLAVVGDDTQWPGASSRLHDESADKSSQTILFVENIGQGVHWMEPRDLDSRTMSLDVNSPDGVSSKYLDPAVVMVDGSLRRLKSDLPSDVLRALLTANGGEPLSNTGKGWKLLEDGRLRMEAEAEEGD